jgi:NAD(P)-dependent dehydrogenase (short-subunit alcohol dehydrogenase family)
LVSRRLEGRVVVITGAGRGLGAEHARLFAALGARVVVNDFGSASDGSGRDEGPAHTLVEEIRAAGGEAVVDTEDVADFDGARRLIDNALDSFGELDVLINNAGILRDRMLVNMTEDDWDAVMRVHLRGHFCPTRHAAGYWREQVKAGETVDARIVCTSSGAGLFGNVGQANYAAAKSGIATFARVAAAELGRYGVTANAIAPIARTRMTENLFAGTMDRPAQGFDAMDPGNIAPLVVWLGSNDSAGVSGHVFEIAGGKVNIADNWRTLPGVDKGDRWEPADLGPVVRELVAKVDPVKVIGAQ